MTTIEFSVMQVALLVGFAPIAWGVIQSIQKYKNTKKFSAPWVSYHRPDSVGAAVALGATLVLAAVLPLLGNVGLSTADGYAATILFLFAIIGVAIGASFPRSRLPRSLTVIGISLIAMVIVGGTGSMSLLTDFFSEGPWFFSIALAVAALAVSVLALGAIPRESESETGVHDVHMLLYAVLGVMVVNFMYPFALVNVKDVDFVLSGLGTAVAFLAFGLKILVAVSCSVAITWLLNRLRITREKLEILSYVLSVCALVLFLWSILPISI